MVIPVLLAVAGGLLWHHHHAAKTKAGPPKVTGVLTPARVAVHQHIMGHEHRPEKLEKAARLFGQEGLHEHAHALASKAAQVREQAKVAAELVECSRAGDQNAIATIVAIREQAKAGSPRACVSCKLLEDYMNKNPPKDAPPTEG